MGGTGVSQGRPTKVYPGLHLHLRVAHQKTQALPQQHVRLTAGPPSDTLAPVDVPRAEPACASAAMAPAVPLPLGQWCSDLLGRCTAARSPWGRPKIPLSPGPERKRGRGQTHTQKHSEAGYGRPVDRSAWTANTVKRPPQQPAHPQYANYWAPLTRKRHAMPHSAQPQHTNYWAPRTRKRHQQEHRPQRPTERSDPTQHAKGRTGDCPGPRKETATRRNVTQGGGV